MKTGATFKSDTSSPTTLMSVEDLARLLQVPATTIYQWKHRGEGPKPIRIGRYLRFDPADVTRWVEGRKAAS